MPKTDRLAQLYDRGPFPAVDVPGFPPELVAQVERLTGRRFDARLFETYERVRAWVGYQGVVLTPDLQAEVVLGTPVVPASAAVEQRPAPVLPVPQRGFRPEDLGD